MSAWAEVEGRLALLNYPTTDGRVLELMDPPMVHFGCLPVPLILQSEGRSDVVGMISRVKIERRQGVAGCDLFGFGQVDLQELSTLRPDLMPGAGLDSVMRLLQAEIAVQLPQTMEVRHEDGRSIVQGRWELRSVTIPREGSEPPWPGIGLRVKEIAEPSMRV